MRPSIAALSMISLSLAFILSPNAIAADHSSDWHCITDHLEEAIRLNTERRDLYSSLTDGESEAISDALISSEEALLKNLKPTLPLLKTYWALGTPVLCRSFRPMSEAPQFSEIFSTPLPEGRVSFANPHTLIFRLGLSQVQKGKRGLIEEGRRQILSLDKADHYQCMTKHVLESIVFNAEVLEEGRVREEGLAEKLRLKSDWLEWISIGAQITTLYTASKVDRMAEAIHRQGIPIICNDVPPILHDLH